MHWRRKWQPTPVFLPGESQGWGNLVGCRLWDHTESDTTERLHFHFSLLCTGEGNGNPLQYSCLENPRDGGTWWAAVYGVAQSRTRLKQLSSSVYMPRFDSWVGKIPWRRDRLPASVFMGFSGDTDSKESACSVGSLEEGMATTPVFLPGESPWTEEPGRLQSMESKSVRHD